MFFAVSVSTSTIRTTSGGPYLVLTAAFTGIPASDRELRNAGMFSERSPAAMRRS